MKMPTNGRRRPFQLALNGRSNSRKQKLRAKITSVRNRRSPPASGASLAQLGPPIGSRALAIQ
jgi:hypothetical protein